MKAFPVLLYLLLLMGSAPSLVVGQSVSREIRGNRDVVIQQRPIERFKHLVVSMGIETELSLTSADSVTIESESSILPYITTENHEDTLILTMDRSRAIVDILPVKVKVASQGVYSINASIGAVVSLKHERSIPSLEIDLSTGGHFIASATLDKLKLVMRDHAVADLTGRASEATFDLSGISHLNAKTFKIDTCNIVLSDASEATINSNTSLAASISGLCSLSYLGTPNNLSINRTRLATVTTIQH